jgi:ABC-2 type transport system permease protein
MSAGSASSPAASAELRLDPLARLGRLVSGTAAIARVEVQKLRHDNLDIFTRSVQPLLWLFVFGTALQHARSLNGGYGDYRAYIAPGVMAQAALFVAIFYGLAVIWERDLGQLQRLLATPLPRLGIVLGKASGASVRAIAQAFVLLAVLAVARIDIRWSVPAILGSLVLLALGTAAFACLSMVLAALVKTRERFMGIGQLVAMPLFFASSALYPLALLPVWLRALARVNPLTYEVEGMRRLLLGLAVGDGLWVDFAVTLAFCAVFAGLAARLYPRAIL